MKRSKTTARRTRILVVADSGAPSQPALEKAARLAACLPAQIEVYSCGWQEGVAGAGRAAAAARRRSVAAGQAALESLARRYIRPPRRFAAVFELGHPRDARILRAIHRARPDLVVLDSHFHPQARRALFGPADWRLIRDCPVPLLYAKPGRWRAAPRIAVAVDPRHPAEPRAGLDRALLAEARRLARACHGSLHVVNAWLPLDPALTGPAALGLPAFVPARVDQLLNEEEAAARGAIEALIRGGDRPRAHVVLLRGAAVETLPAYAELEGLDLLVMGAVSRGRLYELMVGATAERLLERVPCDVLVVKASGRRRRA